MEKQSLKELLQSITNDDYAVPKSVDPYSLSIEMMKHIGDLDSEFRDDLILSILMEWIDRGVLAADEMIEILHTAIDENHLLKGLGNIDDTVFCRTFSAEVVASVISRHSVQKFLLEADLDKAFHTVLKFYNEDIDIRGYVDGKGWAHGAAHGADALNEFAGCDEIGYEGLKEILYVIRGKVNVHHYGYTHYEDERMITPVKAILKRKLIPIEELLDWINSFATLSKTEIYLENMTLEINVCTFLKSLYFRLIESDEYIQLTDEIRRILKEVNRYSNR